MEIGSLFWVLFGLKRYFVGFLNVWGDVIYSFLFVFLDFEKFLISCKNEWEIMLKEVEDRFFELSIVDNFVDVFSELKWKCRKKSLVYYKCL